MVNVRIHVTIMSSTLLWNICGRFFCVNCRNKCHQASNLGLIPKTYPAFEIHIASGYTEGFRRFQV